MSLKLLFDPDDGTILGAQAVGSDGVDKRIDVIATAITGGITADELADLELAYAPPFSSAKDPVNMLGYMAENIRTGACDVVEYDELAALTEAGWTTARCSDTAGARAGRHSRLDQRPARPAPRRDSTANDGPFVVYCEAANGDTPLPRSSTNSASRPATSTAGIAHGSQLTPPFNRSPSVSSNAPYSDTPGLSNEKTANHHRTGLRLGPQQESRRPRSHDQTTWGRHDGVLPGQVSKPSWG